MNIYALFYAYCDSPSDSRPALISFSLSRIFFQPGAVERILLDDPGDLPESGERVTSPAVLPDHLVDPGISALKSIVSAFSAALIT